MSSGKNERTERDSGNHPLVGLLFWMMGKNLQEEASELAESEQLKVQEKLNKEELEIANERIQRRSLSWKDDHPNELLETWHEFADVKGQDIALDGGYEGGAGKSNLKAGTTLSRKPSNIVDEDDEDDKKRCSPNSPNWGFFVAITPPSDLYPTSGTSTATATPQITPTVSREPTPKGAEISTRTVNSKDFDATLTAATAATASDEAPVAAASAAASAAAIVSAEKAT